MPHTEIDDFLYAPATNSRGGILIYPCPSVCPFVRSSVRPIVRPDIDTWFVRLSPSTVLELQL